MQLLFNKDRYQSNPAERTMSCPISFQGDLAMLVPYRIPEYQDDYHKAGTKKERGEILAKFSLLFGLGNDNPDVWRQIHADWIDPMLEKQEVQ